MNKTNQGQIRVMRIIARMNVGGPAVQITGLMRSINKGTFDQRLYSGFCDEIESDYLDTMAQDIIVHRIVGFGRSINLFFDFKAFVLLIKEIRSFKPHIVHTHTAKAGVIGRLASIFSFQKSVRVHTYHGHLLYGYFGKFKTKMVITIEKFLSSYTHQLLAVGNTVREELIQAGIGKIESFQIMPPGLQINLLPNKAIARANLGIQGDKLQATYIGRVTQIKRPDRFLDLVSLAKNQELDIEFLIAGDGALLQYCSERIHRENLPVKLLGWQENIEQVLAASDIVVLTSDNEGTPLSLIQAGMAGLPVLTTNVGSIPEVVLHNQTGIVTSLKIEDLILGLEKLVTQDKLREFLGKNAIAFTHERFGLIRLTNEHEQLYKRLFANQASF